MDHAAGTDVTDEFVRYARPLVGDDMITLPMIDGRQRLARLAADSRIAKTGEIRSPGRPAQTLASRFSSASLFAGSPPMYDITPKHKFFVGIDSDGCAFDTMELKHKECFIPAIILQYNLQGISKYAREAAEFVNLYSRSRGINRFPALIETLEWLQKRPEVQAAARRFPFPPGWSLG